MCDTNLQLTSTWTSRADCCTLWCSVSTESPSTAMAACKSRQRLQHNCYMMLTWRYTSLCPISN